MEPVEGKSVYILIPAPMVDFYKTLFAYLHHILVDLPLANAMIVVKDVKKIISFIAARRFSIFKAENMR